MSIWLTSIAVSAGMAFVTAKSLCASHVITNWDASPQRNTRIRANPHKRTPSMERLWRTQESILDGSMPLSRRSAAIKWVEEAVLPKENQPVSAATPV
jgi:hypothetical protein